jgi:hypothetical protein
MHAFLNLRLAVRLGIAFGALLLALAVVAFSAGRSVDRLKERTNDLATHDMVTLQLSKDIVSAVDRIGLLTGQHLYVFDGDLEGQDDIQEQALALHDQYDADVEALEPLLEEESSRQALAAFSAADESFDKQWKKAFSLSRQETVDEVRSATARVPSTPRSCCRPWPAPRRRARRSRA